MKRALVVLACTVSAAAPAAPPPPAFPPLRTGALAPSTVLGTGTTQHIGKCDIEQHAGAGHVVRELVARCNYARAIAMASGGGTVMITQSSQQGLEPALFIDDKGNVRVEPQKALGTVVRYANGSFQFGVEMPPGAPVVPPGMLVFAGDGTSIFAISYETGNELVRGTLDHGAWKFERAFAARVPAAGYLYSPVFLLRAAAEPTIVYVDDPQHKGDVTVRLGGGKLVTVPRLSKTAASPYRLSAIDVAFEPLPAIATNVDNSLVVAWPTGGDTYSVRALAGALQFDGYPPPATGASPIGGRCSEVTAEREREEVYAPQLFDWKGVGLAYLSTRVHEQVRWTFVPVAGKTPDQDRTTCDWVVDKRSRTRELVVMHVDASSAKELVRVPVVYHGEATGSYGPALLVERAGNVLHAVATIEGEVTYARVSLDGLP